MNITICGASGFIGKNLVQYFSKKNTFKIRAIYFNSCIPTTIEIDGPIEWVRCDLTDKQSVQGLFNNQEAVLQFAAVTSGAKDIVERPYIHVNSNAIMNSILIQEAFECGVEHFLFPSCSIVYHRSEIPLTEKDYDPAKPIYKTYFGSAHTKLYIEKVLEFYSSIGSMRSTVIRHSNIYGPHDKFDLFRGHMLASTIIKAIAKTSEIILWGDGSLKRDFLYIDDMVDMVEKILLKQKNPFEIYNCGSGRLTDISQLIGLLSNLLNKHLNVTYDISKPNFDFVTVLECSKALREFGWHPKTSLEQGLDQTINWLYNQKL